MRLSVRLGLLGIFCFVCSAPSFAAIINGDFETGDFTGWTTQDLINPYFTLTVDSSGSGGWMGPYSAGSGVFLAAHGFDGDGPTGPNPIRIAQDVPIPLGSSTLSFDWRIFIDQFAGSARTFSLNIEPGGGGPTLFSQTLFDSSPIIGTGVFDTGVQNDSIDVSAFGGQTVRLAFDSFIPDNFSGPAQLELDNVVLTNTPTANPEPSAFALSALGLLSLGFVGWRRRRC